jgi:hypothetical protein
MNGYAITREQLDRCSPVIDLQTGELFWMVLAETDDLTEYRTQFHPPTPERSGYWSCTCPSGQSGFTNVRHPSGTCKHCRWSAVAQQVYVGELSAQLVAAKAA